ncbi:hypothetical protein LT493_42790 [Streptomyces tricolor]|nr:hypothetical protein [Streptomyces tricolor]
MNHHDPTDGLHCLVTGATGYTRWPARPRAAGRRAPGALPRPLPGKLRDHPWAGAVEVVRGDVTDAAAVAEAMRDIDVAYYLVHTLGSGKDFEETDRRAARVFGSGPRRPACGASCTSAVSRRRGVPESGSPACGPGRRWAASCWPRAYRPPCSAPP